MTLIQIIQEYLLDQEVDPSTAQMWAKHIASDIRSALPRLKREGQI
jgi:hypothetical protein